MLFLLKRRRSPRRYGMKNMNIIGIRMISAVAAVMLWFAGSASAKGSASLREARMNDGYTFKLNENVRRTRVTFKNRFGIVLAGDLYEPKAGGGKFSAIAVCGAFGGVKEQASGFYANEMASRGFITLAFDPSFTGDSGGDARYVASFDINTDDFSAAIDYLSNLGSVDPERIGIIGICGWGGMALNVAAADTRIKAVVTSTMYDMHRLTVNGYFDSSDDADARYAMKERLNAQRTKDFKSGTPALAGGLPDKLTGDEPQFIKDYFDYYKTPRGYHKNSVNSNNGWTVTSALSLLNTPLLAYAGEIRSPVLMIHGEKAHSRYFSEDVSKKLSGGNKELMIIPGASHVDLYDNAEKIPFAKIAEFFKTNLK